MHRRKIAEMKFVGGVFSYRESDEGEDGTWCDWWDYEDLRYPLTRVMAAAGVPREEVTISPITMDDMRKGCWDPKARLEDMDVNWVEASLSFPTFPRFCGQTFLERKDKELADLCVKAYNDWQFDEWCAGSGGRLDPAADHPALGRRARGRRGAPQRRARRRTRCASPRSRRSSACRRSTTPTATGTRSSGRARRPRPSCRCTSGRARRCRRRRRTRRPRSVPRSRT